MADKEQTEVSEEEQVSSAPLMLYWDEGRNALVISVSVEGNQFVVVLNEKNAQQMFWVIKKNLKRYRKRGS